MPRRSNSSKKTAQARPDIRKLKARAQQFFSKRPRSNKTKFPQAHPLIIFPAPAETETKKLGKPNKKLRNPTKPNKKIKRANSNRHCFPCHHHANKKLTHKNPKATGELGIFARAKRRIINARTQFNEGNEPFATAKKKSTKNHPNGELIAQMSPP